MIEPGDEMSDVVMPAWCFWLMIAMQVTLFVLLRLSRHVGPAPSVPSDRETK